MTTKRCFKCLCNKPLGEFYVHPMMADGRLGKCKECAKADVMQNRLDKIEYYRDYDKFRASVPHRVAAHKEYAKTPAGRVSHETANRKWAAANPSRRKASNLVSKAVLAGKLIKTPCHVCGHAVVEGHHPDYSRPLDVVWLCMPHHKEIHFPF